MKLTTPLLAFCMLVLTSSFAFSASWEHVPLTTKKQAMAGVQGGEGAQYVYTIAYAPSLPSRAYLGGDTIGVWRSDDDGAHWRPMLNTFKAHGARSLAVDPLNHDIVVAAAFLGTKKADRLLYKEPEEGIYYTNDGGNTWRLIYEAMYYSQDSKGDLFAFVPNPGETERTRWIYAALPEGGLLRSEDGGGNWKKMWDGKWQGKLCELIDIKLLHDGKTPTTREQHRLLMATSEGLFVFDGKRTSKLDTNLPVAPVAIATSPAEPQVILAALGKNGLFRSEDGGASFIKTFNSLGRSVTEVAMSQVDASVAFARGHRNALKPLYSSDGGKSWHEAVHIDTKNLLDKKVFWFSSPIATHPIDSNVALLATNAQSKIMKTTDGGRSWEYSGSGYTGIRMSNMLFMPSGDTYLSFTDHGIWLKKNNTDYFTQLDIERVFGLTSVSTMATDGENIIAAVGAWGKQGIAYGPIGKNGQVKWKYYTETDGNLRASHAQASPLLWGVGNFISRNKGQTWQNLNKRVLFYKGGAAPVIYAVEEAAYMPKRAQIVSSKDYGASWQPVGPSLPVQMRAVTTAAVLPADGTNPEELLVASANGVYKLKQGTWKLYAHDAGITKDHFGSTFVSSLTVSPVTPSVVFLGRRSPGYGRGAGVFVSTDRGETWRDANYGMPPESIFSIKINPYDNTAYLGTSIGLLKLKQE